MTPLRKKDETYIEFTERKGNPEFPDEYLQVVFLPEDQEFDFDVFGLKLRFCELILDESGQGKEILKVAEKFYEDGPKEWSKEYTESRIKKSLGYLNKMERLLEEEELGQLFERICYYYTENIIPWWFGSRGLWPLRPQQAFEYIEKEDSEFYSQLEKVFGNTSNAEKVAASRKLHEVLFTSEDS